MANVDVHLISCEVFISLVQMMAEYTLLARPLWILQYSIRIIHFALLAFFSEIKFYM